MNSTEYAIYKHLQTIFKEMNKTLVGIKKDLDIIASDKETNIDLKIDAKNFKKINRLILQPKRNQQHLQ